MKKIKVIYALNKPIAIRRRKDNKFLCYINPDSISFPLGRQQSLSLKELKEIVRFLEKGK